MNNTAKKSFAPIHLWATLGALMCLFSAYIFGQWLLSEEAFRAVPIGPQDTLPEGGKLTIRVVEVLSSLVALTALYIYWLRPLIRERKWPLEGLLLLGALITYSLDTTINYYDYFMAWNKHAVNFGTWGSFFPGHTGPSEYAEAIFWGPPMYLYFGVALASIQRLVVGGSIKIGIKSPIALFITAFAAAFLFDVIVEGTLVRLEIYAWPHTIKALTLWAGETYQFPLYESFLVAIYATMYSYLLRDKDTYGYTIIERGAQQFEGHKLIAMRFLAATGFAALCTALYFIGFNIISLGADNLVEMPPYLMYSDPNWIR